MRFDLEGLDVFFPYPAIYKEQHEYMLNLKRAIDAKGHALLEMPTGKLIYCTRTVQEIDREAVDSICRSMTASWVRTKAGVKKSQLCSYYETYEKDSSSADVPIGVYSLDDIKNLGRKRGWCPYFMARHMLNPNLVSKELEAESIVVFDEAHNIDNVCIEAFSVVLDKRKMDASMRGVNRISAKVGDIVTQKRLDFQKDYDALVQGLISEGAYPLNDQHRGHPALTEDQLQEAVPGSIRKNAHFVAFLKKIVTALAFLRSMSNHTVADRSAMRHTSSRLNALMRSLEIAKLEDFSALIEVATFATLLATYTEEGFNTVFEPQGSVMAGISEPLLQLCCVDASIAIKPVLQRFRSVIITSGTLMDPAVIRNFGELLIDVAATVPDGVFMSKWDEWGIITRIFKHKLIFIETKDVLETQEALANFKRSCDCGRGAVAEGVDFDRHYGRAVLLFGIPIQYTQSHVLRARMAFMLEKYQIREQDFLVFDALRQAAQCVGRVIRSKEDYGVVILADYRYNKQDKRSKLPQWVQQFMRESSLNCSTDTAIDYVKSFLKAMGQPVDRQALQNIVLTQEQVIENAHNVSALALQQAEKEKEAQVALGLKLRPEWHAKRAEEEEARKAALLAEAEKANDEHDQNRQKQLPADAADSLMEVDETEAKPSNIADVDSVEQTELLQVRIATSASINKQAKQQLDNATYEPYISAAEQEDIVEKVTGSKRTRYSQAMDMLLDD
eukprot:GSChrysophyteH1.ASY1.ANO1.2019.1 assembled CDS